MAYCPKVAIACQGGGSHAAFAAGVLQELLSNEDLREGFELIGLSGTSGGAMCAALAWAGLQCGGPDDAIARLTGFWNQLKADDPFDYWANALGLVSTTYFPVEISPYLVPAPAALIMSDWLKRHLRLEEVPSALAPAPNLLVGATDVLSGRRTIFKNNGVTYTTLIASAAVPFLYEAVEVEDEGKQKFMWDGLFSVNPPIRDLIDLPIEELWVIQINPQDITGVPKSTSDIIDRRNELSGNLALAQELHFVHTINKLLDAQAKLGDGTLPLGDGERNYKKVEIRLVDAGLTDFSYASKLDRRPALIDDLMARGRAAAHKFFCPDLSHWPRDDALTHESRLVTQPPQAR